MGKQKQQLKCVWPERRKDYLTKDGYFDEIKYESSYQIFLLNDGHFIFVPSRYIYLMGCEIVFH